MVDLFLNLVKIPSPSGNELAVARYIQNHLKKLGIKSYTDNAGRSVLSNVGNVIAKIGNGNPKLMFVAHMDTVEDGKRIINPIVRNGVIKSDGTTILGSDDKAAVAALLEAMKVLKNKEIPTTYCVFSLREEKGVMGVNYLDLDKNIDFVFDVDGSNPPGQFIHTALGNQSFEVQIYGKDAHAAKDPERGRNAIKTAGLIISKLKFGRDKDWNVLNIGTIAGGTRNNVIPGYCVLAGEARATTLKGIDKILLSVEKAATEACRVTKCKYKLIRRELDVPLNTPKSAKIIKLAKMASKSVGIKFSLVRIPATIQGCALAAKGYQTLGLSKGGKFPHSKMESIKIKELEKTKRLIVEIVNASKRI
ncbi:MAG: M20/M25/M40 family metallo-hydrolase [Candidatus Micrarchaeales archaeon]|nr:M20/M25/M40 family metallo-hydrolase [Candidatus Micrarchaeales archaeon]